jgi:hypothetical protein
MMSKNAMLIILIFVHCSSFSQVSNTFNFRQLQ